MAKFYGEIGYGQSVENVPGVWDDVITERKAYGDVIPPTSRSLQAGDKVNNDITVNNSISIVADAFANANYFAIRYARWNGVLWVVSDVSIVAPRLILRLGGVYSGRTP